MRFGRGGRKDNHDFQGSFEDSFISAISRPNCVECYEAGAIDCSSNFALRMLAVTVNGESLPDKFGTGYDVICKEEQFDSKAFLRNVIFENYNQNYTESNLALCQSNVVFKPHPTASDITGSHHLHNTTCNNCTNNSVAFFTPPDEKNFGWDGGCGNFLCTGKNNYLIHDWDGAFLGSPGILIPNNS